MSFGVLIVGLGQIGMGYDMKQAPELVVLSHARAFQLHRDFELVGGVDSNALKLKLFESEYACLGYCNLKEALVAIQPDVVVIALPTDLHYQTLVSILKYCKPKAILCEKPLAYDFKQARLMVGSCESSGVELYVNYMRRSDPGVIEIKRRLHHGQIAPPYKGVCWYSKGLLNNGSHFMNLLQYWLGDVVEFQVVSQGRLWNGLDPEPDLKVVFDSGEVFFLAAREENYSHYTVELVCGNGRLRYDDGGANICWQPVVNDSICEGYRTLDSHLEYIKSDLNQIQLRVVEQLAVSLAGVEANICTGREALNTSEILSRV